MTAATEKLVPPVPPLLKRSTLAPHGAQLAPKFEQEDEWQEFVERTDTTKLHDFGYYWWTYGRDEDEDGFLREAVFLEVPLKKEVEASQLRVKLTTRHLMIEAQGQKVIDHDFEDPKWLNVSESYWEIEVKEVKKVKRKVLRYVLYILMGCPKYITKWLFASEKVEDDGRFIDQDEEECDNIDDRLRLIGRMKEPEPHRDPDIWFSDTEEEDEHWCDGCGSTRIVVMQKAGDESYMKYCNDCPYVSPAKHNDLPTGLMKQRDTDIKRAKKKRLQSRRQEARRKLEEARERAAGEPDRTEEVPEDYKRGERTRVMSHEEFCEELKKAVDRGDVKWETA